MDRGADRWLTSRAARELIVDQGRVVGVRVENVESGKMIDYYADAVILGCGGMASNIDMIQKYRPDLKDMKVLEGSHVGATGDGYDMVADVGGIQTHMDELWFYVFSIPDHKDPRGRRGLVVRGLPDSIWVNMRGTRFHNEDLQGGASGAPAIMSQDPPHSWTIIDDTMKDGMTVGDPQYYQPGTVQKDPSKVEVLFKESPHIRHADTLEELAVEIGVPQDTFVDPCADTTALSTAPWRETRTTAGRWATGACWRSRLSTRCTISHWPARISAASRRTCNAGSWTSITNPFQAFTRPASWREWPVVTLTAALGWKERCWVRVYSADGSPARGRPKRRDSAQAS